MKITEKLTEMGHELPPVAAPVAAYVPARLDGNTVRTSGQLPLKNGELVSEGRCGTEGATVAAAQCAARQCALNAIAAAGEAAGGVDKLNNATKVTGFVASAPDFYAQPVVINAASELLEELFDAPHIRSAVGVAALPLGATVEIEVEFTLA